MPKKPAYTAKHWETSPQAFLHLALISAAYYLNRNLGGSDAWEGQESDLDS